MQPVPERTRPDALASMCTKAAPYGAATVIGAYGLLGGMASAMVVAMALFGLILHVTGIRRFPMPDAVKAWSAVILAYVVAGLALAAWHYQAGASAGNSLNRLAFLCFLPLCAFFSLPPREQLLETIKSGAAIGAIVVFVFALGEYALSGNRVWLGAGNQGPFSVVAAVAFSTCVISLLSGPDRKQAVLFIAGALAAAMCVLLSGMRSMLPALVLVPLLGVVMMRGNWNRTISRGHVVKVAVVVLAMMAVAGFFALPRFEALFANWEKVVADGNYDTSFGRRLVMWDYALQVIADHFWLGLGHEAMMSGLDGFSEEKYGFSLIKTHLHNFVLTALVEGGVVSLFMVLAVLLAPLFLLKSPCRDTVSKFAMALMTCVSLVYLLSGSVNILFNHDVMDLMYLTCCGVSVALAFPRNTSVLRGKT